MSKTENLGIAQRFYIKNDFTQLISGRYFNTVLVKLLDLKINHAKNKGLDSINHRLFSVYLNFTQGSEF